MREDTMKAIAALVVLVMLSLTAVTMVVSVVSAIMRNHTNEQMRYDEKIDMGGEL